MNVNCDSFTNLILVFRPFDYSKVAGVRISKTLKVESAKGIFHDVPIELVVLPKT